MRRQDATKPAVYQNCDAHPLLKLFHKPERDKAGKILPPELQDKRAVVPIERQYWNQWLNGSIEDATALIQLPAPELFRHGSAGSRRASLLPL